MGKEKDRLGSYELGFNDLLNQFGIEGINKFPSGRINPNLEDEGKLDDFQYLKGKVEAMEKILKYLFKKEGEQNK